MTIAELLIELVALIGSSSVIASDEAALLLMQRTAFTRAQLITYPERDVALDDVEWLRAAAQRRASGEPLAYILGEAWFYGRRFTVDARVLMPRPETEHLIDEALNRQPMAQRCLDIGTGSGAIALTLACEYAHAQVTAIDISHSALEVARANAVELGVAARVHFYEGNLLAPLTRAVGQGGTPSVLYDIVIANLPYIPSADVPLKPDPVGFEPVIALDGGADGLHLYRDLLAELPRFLADKSVVLLEAAPPTIPGLLALVEQLLPSAQAGIGYDYASLQRFVYWQR